MGYAKESLKALWLGLLEIADKDNDQRIELQEWLTLMRRTLEMRQSPSGWFEKYGEYMFKLFDVSADNVLDISEYVDGMNAYGLSTREATEAFKKIAV
uniref:EF-hand domain-containing protein n=1 Tax=Romanomermis culicivorax TaxID=13658 RepID=A0A915L941_ROMCU